MAAVFRHHGRKLFGDNETNNNSSNSIPTYCKDYCFSTPRLCSANCSSFCPKICFYPPAPPVAPDSIQLPPIDNVLFPPPQHKQNNPNSTFVLAITASIIFAFIFLSCCLRLWQIRFGTRRRRSRRAEAAAAQQQQPPQEQEEIYSGLMVDHPIWYIRTVGLHSSIINAITVCKYKEVEGLEGRAECSVCLNVFEEEEIVRMLPKCKHAFHVSCIDTWLKSHKNCPVCRVEIELMDIKFPSSGT